MRVTVDLGRCNAYGNCVIEAPDVFDIDDGSGLAIVLDEHPPEERRAKVTAAARLCPVLAITVED
ncbi:MAG TPA: ferredoxin [Conexibacter sp.]|nr:ferredoxin [Conexibacter sp.]